VVSEIKLRRRPYIVGVMGSHREEGLTKEARLIGRAVAERGCVLLTGGGPGLMRAAAQGAHEAGGLVIGILPNERSRPLPGYPNEFVDIPIYTGLSDARNVINAKTPHVLIALNGSVGTISEIAFALRAGTPVIGFCCPEFSLNTDEYPFKRVTSVDAAIREMDAILKKWAGNAEDFFRGVPVI